MGQIQYVPGKGAGFLDAERSRGCVGGQRLYSWFPGALCTPLIFPQRGHVVQ